MCTFWSAAMTFLVQINQGLEVHLFVSLQLRIVQQNVKLESLYAAQEKTLFEWWIVERQFSSVTARGKKQLCSLVAWQRLLLHPLPDLLWGWRNNTNMARWGKPRFCHLARVFTAVPPDYTSSYFLRLWDSWATQNILNTHKPWK